MEVGDLWMVNGQSCYLQLWDDKNLKFTNKKHGMWIQVPNSITQNVFPLRMKTNAT